MVRSPRNGMANLEIMAVGFNTEKSDLKKAEDKEGNDGKDVFKNMRPADKYLLYGNHFPTIFPRDLSGFQDDLIWNSGTELGLTTAACLPFSATSWRRGSK
jgi:hypothetical protein